MGIFDRLFGKKETTSNSKIEEEDDIQNGLKKVFHENGNLWVEVNMKNGMRDGVEKQYFKDGKILSEQIFKQGELNGYSKFYNESGVLTLHDNYKNDKLNGLCKVFYQNGLLKKETNFKENIKDGKEIEYMDEIPEGTNYQMVKFSQDYKLGKPNGKFIQYFTNQLIKGDDGFYQLIKKEDQYSNGYLEKLTLYFDPVNDNTEVQMICEEQVFSNDGYNSVWKSYFPNGKIRNIINYKHTEKNDFEKCVEHGLKIQYFENGKVEVESNIVDGLTQGLLKGYYETGFIKHEDNYTNGELNGTIKTYYPNEKIRSLEHYEKDRFIKSTCFDEDGKEIRCDQLK